MPAQGPPARGLLAGVEIEVVTKHGLAQGEVDLPTIRREQRLPADAPGSEIADVRIIHMLASLVADAMVGREVAGPERAIGAARLGFIANQSLRLGGIIDAAAAGKGVRFIAFCDAFGLPLVSLIDVPGFLIGSGAERSGLGRRSAKLPFEWAHATVPRVSVALRKGYRLGYIAMAGDRSMQADAAFAWPSAEICAMSIEGSVDIAYRPEVAAAADPAARRQDMIEAIRARTGRCARPRALVSMT
jgi:hypothetical protein